MNGLIEEQGFALTIGVENEILFFCATLDEAIEQYKFYNGMLKSISVRSATRVYNEHGWPNTGYQLGSSWDAQLKLQNKI